MKIKQIIVRTGRDKGSRATLGKIHETTNDYGYGNSTSLFIGAGWEIKKGHYRKATKEEIEAFNQGIRHIDDIPKKTLTYEIY